MESKFVWAFSCLNLKRTLFYQFCQSKSSLLPLVGHARKISLCGAESQLACTSRVVLLVVVVGTSSEPQSLWLWTQVLHSQHVTLRPLLWPSIRVFPGLEDLLDCRLLCVDCKCHALLLQGWEIVHRVGFSILEMARDDLLRQDMEGMLKVCAGRSVAMNDL